MLAVTEHHVAHVSHAQTVHQNGPYRYLARHFGAFMIQLQHISRRQNKGILLIDPQALGNLGLRL